MCVYVYICRSACFYVNTTPPLPSPEESVKKRMYLSWLKWQNKIRATNPTWFSLLPLVYISFLPCHTSPLALTHFSLFSPCISFCSLSPYIFLFRCSLSRPRYVFLYALSLYIYIFLPPCFSFYLSIIICAYRSLPRATSFIISFSSLSLCIFLSRTTPNCWIEMSERLLITFVSFLIAASARVNLLLAWLWPNGLSSMWSACGVQAPGHFCSSLLRDGGEVGSDILSVFVLTRHWKYADRSEPRTMH